MTMFMIGALKNEPELKEILLKEIKFLSREGIKLTLSEKLLGKTPFINCTVVEDDDEMQNSHEKILQFYLANVITDFLMNEVAKTFILRLAKQRCQEVGEDGFGSIIQNSYTYLNNLHEEGDIGKTLSRHNWILTEVSRYLEQNRQLDLEGFFRFRLKDYFQELNEAVEKAVSNFVMEKEYLEFLRLLRYFVDVQEPKIDEVHVLFQTKQDFFILDEALQPIKPGQLEGMLAQLDQEIEYEDWLLSALITLAPRRIILHIICPVEVVEIIINVFQHRATICGGCELCGKKRQLPDYHPETGK
jgi:putative sporulation protein YtxC